MKQFILTLILFFISSVSYGEALAQLKECSFCTILYGPGHLQCDCDKKTQVTGKKRKIETSCPKCLLLSLSLGSEYKGCSCKKNEAPKKKKVKKKCIHGKQKRYCKECGGSAYCTHGKQKQFCKECGSSAYCTHGQHKAYCKKCKGSAFCTHGKQKKRCKTCKTPCPHAEKMYKCKEGCYVSWAQRKLREEGAAASAAI